MLRLEGERPFRNNSVVRRHAAETALHSVRAAADVEGGRRLLVDFGSGAERFPALVLLPRSPRPVPAALLLHGFTLDKERMAATGGLPLLERVIASLAPDLPLHGERYEAVNLASMRTPLELMRRWRGALDEASLALRYLAAAPEIDGARLGLVGYSLGAFLGLKVAVREPAVRAMVAAAAGDIPEYVPFRGMVRAVADPLHLVRRLRGRPLLFLHGRYDRTIPPAEAERLYQAAGEPKELRWWESGHILPAAAIADAAEWLAERLAVD